MKKLLFGGALVVALAFTALAVASTRPRQVPRKALSPVLFYVLDKRFESPMMLPHRECSRAARTTQSALCGQSSSCTPSGV